MNRYLIILIATVFMTSCNRDTCSKNLGFKLDYHLFDHIKTNGNTYCELVNKAFLRDKQAIIDLSKVNVGDGASYQHGAVLIEVIDKLTEQEYLNIIQNLSDKEKKHLYYSILPAGLEFTTNSKYERKHIEIAFPILSLNLE